MTLEEKREAVVKYYEKAYRDANKLPFKVHTTQMRKPAEIERHYQNMQQMKRALAQFYEDNIGLKNKLDHLRGLKPVDPTEKREPHE